MNTMTILVVLLVAGLVFYALYKKSDVKANLKIPFASFSIEAKDRGNDPQKQIKDE